VTACDLHRNNKPVCNNTEYSTKLFTDEAEAVIAAHAPKKDQQPLFLYLAHQAVHIGNYPTAAHTDYWMDQAPDRYIAPYRWVQDPGRRNISAMVTVLDESVGNVTAALKRHGMWDDTLLVFSTVGARAIL
jgi:arylsulfatase A-like enzyme